MGILDDLGALNAVGGLTPPRQPLQIDPAAQGFHAAGPIASAPKNFPMPIKKSSDNLSDLIDSNFSFGGSVIGNRTVPIESLNGGVRSSDPKEGIRVRQLAAQINGPGGYFERPVVDDAGNVIEGQHRLDAARLLGFTHVPVTMIKDISRGYDTDAMSAAVKSAGKYHPDQVRQLVGRALDSINREGSPAAAAQNTTIGGQWEAGYQAAINAARFEK